MHSGKNYSNLVFVPSEGQVTHVIGRGNSTCRKGHKTVSACKGRSAVSLSAEPFPDKSPAQTVSGSRYSRKVSKPVSDSDFYESDSQIVTCFKTAKSAWFNAAQGGMIGKLIELVEEGFDINQVDESGQTALHIAVSSKNLLAVEYLLQLKIDVDAFSLDGMTALHRAAYRGYSQILESLLIGGAEIKLLTRDSKNSVLHLAAQSTFVKVAQRDCVKCIQILMEYDADISWRDSFHQTALHLAVSSNNLPAVEHLLHLKIDVDALSFNGMTALHLAAYKGYSQILESLLIGGADIRLLARVTHNSALHLAVQIDKQSKFVKIEQRNSVKCIQILMEYVADISCRNISYQTPLHLAVSFNNLPAVEHLLQFKIDVDAFSLDGMTALHLAAYRGYSEILESLLIGGAEIKLLTRNRNNSVLHLAARIDKQIKFVESAQRNSVKCIRILTDQNADLLFCKNAAGQEPAGVASQSGNTEALTLLRTLKKAGKKLPATVPAASSGVEKPYYQNTTRRAESITMHSHSHGRAAASKSRAVNALPNTGDSLRLVAAGHENTIQSDKNKIHHMARNGNIYELERCLNNGYTVHQVNEHGRTALHYAASFGHTKCVQHLINQNSNVNAADNEGMTALHMASYYNKPKALGILLKYVVDKGVGDKDGNTALHKAAQADAVDCICLLFEAGADTKCKNNNGQTPREFAEAMSKMGNSEAPVRKCPEQRERTGSKPGGQVLKDPGCAAGKGFEYQPELTKAVDLRQEELERNKVIKQGVQRIRTCQKELNWLADIGKKASIEKGSSYRFPDC